MNILKRKCPDRGSLYQMVWHVSRFMTSTLAPIWLYWSLCTYVIRVVTSLWHNAALLRKPTYAASCQCSAPFLLLALAHGPSAMLTHRLSKDIFTSKRPAHSFLRRLPKAAVRSLPCVLSHQPPRSSIGRLAGDVTVLLKWICSLQGNISNPLWRGTTPRCAWATSPWPYTYKVNPHKHTRLRVFSYRTQELKACLD